LHITKSLSISEITMQQLHRNTQQEDGDDFNSTTNTDRTRRFNFLSLLPLTTDPSTDVTGKRLPIEFRINVEISGWLAYYHYTNQSSNLNNVAPDVHNRLASCDIDFHYAMRDSKFSAVNAVREFLDSYDSSNDDVPSSFNNTAIYPEGSLLHDLQEILNQSKQQRDGITRPHAVVGSGRSAVSSAISYMTSAFMIPQISSGSTAAYLDNKDIYTTFARTIPTNSGDAKAMALYLHHLNVTHVGNIFINDGYGNDYHLDLARELSSFNITVFPQPYDDLSIEQSVKQLAASQFKYIIALLNPSNWKTVIRLANKYQIIGRPDYFWIFEQLQFISASFQLDRVLEADLAQALHGSAVIAISELPYEPFDMALSYFTQNESLRSLYISQHDEPEIFNNYSFPAPSRSIYQYVTYDAVIAMMLAACEAPVDQEYGNITGAKIYEQLLRTEFEGVSGYVAFDPHTGTRKSNGLIYGVRNIQFPDNLISEDAFHVLVTLTDIATLNGNNSSSTGLIKTIAPLYFASNTTIPPLPLPLVDIYMNLIPKSIRAFCLSLCGFVMVISIWWILWTYMNREKDVVKASQPIFLCQICIGTFIIASAVIPMSLQEPISNNGLDIACMTTPWLISVGFVTTFSALFTKTWRLNKVFHNSRNLRRVVVRPRDVALPFIILMTINISVLLAWTFDAPLVWERKLVANYDTFGRNVESVGRCVMSDTKFDVVYLSLIVVINLSVLLFANYQAYIARTLPTEFSESTYITIAMGSLLEVCILGIPLLFLSSSDPTIGFLIRSILATASSLSALLPIFLPKYFQRNINKRYHDAVVAKTGAAPMKSRIVVSGMGNRNLYDDDVQENDQYATGVTKIRRNQDYFKEKEASVRKEEGSRTIRGLFTIQSSREGSTSIGGSLSPSIVEKTNSLRSSNAHSEAS
jgi:hypothetical protein